MDSTDFDIKCVHEDNISSSLALFYELNCTECVFDDHEWFEDPCNDCTNNFMVEGTENRFSAE